MNIDKAKLIEAIENSCYGQNYVQYDDILKIINSIPTTEPKLPTVEELRNLISYNHFFESDDPDKLIQEILTILKSKQPE